MFGSGRIFDRVEELAALARPTAHGSSSTAITPSWRSTGRSASGGGNRFLSRRRVQICDVGRGLRLHACAAGFGPRPPITGWFAEFEDLTLPPGSVGYAKDASRFLGATFDPSALYRFTAVRRMLADNGFTTARISAHVERLQRQLLDSIAVTGLSEAELLNPLDGRPHARFLAFRSPSAQRWYAALKEQN